MSRAARTRLRPHRHRLQQLPQPALPEVPGSSAPRSGWPSARPSCCAAPYFHVVFTLPAPIGDIAYQNKARDLRPAVQGVGRDDCSRSRPTRSIWAPGSASPSVLHTWGSAMTHHPHVHMIVPGGGLSLDGSRWIACRPDFFLPVRGALAPVPAAVAGEAAAAHDAGQLAVLRRARASRRRDSVQAPSWRRCARPSGSSMPSARSPGPSRCSPISPATPTASPSPTAD